MFCSCGQQNLVNLIGGSVNKYEEFILEREKKSQENKLLSCVSVLLVSTKTLMQEKTCFGSLFSLASNKIVKVL